MNRNKNNNYNNNSRNSQKTYSNDKRYNNYNNTNGLKTGANSKFNDSKDNSNDSSNHLANQNMPGIPVNRTVSSPPFPNVCHDIKTDDKSLSLNPSDDASTDKNGLQIDHISNGLSAIGLKDNKDSESKSNDNDSHSKTESQTKTDCGNNNEMVFSNRRKTFPFRRNTTGSVDNYNYRFNKRFNKPFNSNNSSFHYNNSNKFYRNNDRFNNSHKYESNDQNKTFKNNSFTPSISSVITTGGDFLPNVNSYTAPNMFFVNPCDPHLQFNPYLIQYPMYSLANQPIGYPLPQTIPQNNDESLNGKQKEMNKQSVQEMDYSKSTNALVGAQTVATFVPYQWSPEIPSPPIYYGFINPIISESGLRSYYFVSQYPPNIVPLLLDIDPNGVPILPSNCKLIFV